MPNISPAVLSSTADGFFLPFLYQTRTLRTQPAPISRKALLAHARASYSTSALTFSQSTHPHAHPPSNAAVSFSSPDVDSPSAVLGHEKENEAVSHGEPNTPENAADPDASANAENVAEPIPERQSFLKRKAAVSMQEKSQRPLTRPPPTARPPTRPIPKQSTITKQEEKTFSRIIESIIADGNGSSKDAQTATNSSAEGTVTPDTTVREKSFAAEADAAPDGIAHIFRSAVKGMRGDTSEGAEKKGGRKKRATKKVRNTHQDGMLQLEKERLAKMFERLQQFQYEGEEEHRKRLTRVEVAPEQLVQLVAKRERQKIHDQFVAVIRQGKGDLGVWGVCQRLVFGMLAHLEAKDIEQLQSSFSSGGGENIPWDVPAGRAKSGPLEIPPALPALPVVSVLYPEMVLYVMQFLKNNFPTSEIISQVLPELKARGRLSYVLGASTALYNELLSYRWRVYSDLPNVIVLLKEMEESGVKFDQQTHDLIDEIREQRLREKREFKHKMDVGRAATRSWWDTEAIQTAFRELAGVNGGSGWISRSRDQVDDSKRPKRRERRERIQKTKTLRFSNADAEPPEETEWMKKSRTGFGLGQGRRPNLSSKIRFMRVKGRPERSTNM